MFEALFHYLLPAVSKATGSGSGLLLADEFILVLMKLAMATTNQDLAYTVPLNCNFIFPCVILCGTTSVLQCIHVTCLRVPRLLVSCNIHVSWKYMRGNTRLVEVNT